MRERFDVDPAAEWSLLLGWCEAAVRDAAPTALGSARSLDPQPRIAGPGSGWYHRGGLA